MGNGNSGRAKALRRWIRRAVAPGAAAIALLFQVSCLDLSGDQLAGERLSTGDSYTWLTLIESWRESGRWSPRVVSHNAPYGVETHLTLPYAALVAVLARPVALVVPPEDAVRVAGQLAGPVLHVAAVVVLAWGTMAVLGPGGAVASVAAFHVMLGLARRFGVQTFDHHALHMALAFALLALLLRYAAERRTALAAGAGVAAGGGVWAGVEMLIPAGIGGLALGLCWATFGGAWRARGCFAYATGMATALAVALVIERPLAEWDALDLDRLSGAHCLMGGLLAVAAAIVAWVQRRWPNTAMAPRFALAVFATGSVAVAMWAAVEDFFRGPYGLVDAVVQDHLNGLLGDLGGAEIFRASPELFGFHLWLGVLVAARVVAGLGGSQRDAWALLAVGLVVGGLAAFLRFRLTWHYEVFACVALGSLVAVVGSSLWRRPTVVRAACLPAMLALLLSPYVGLVTGVLLTPAGADALWSGRWRDAGCDWAALGEALGALSERDGGTIVTYAAPGPELAYLSGHGVVATGCHCNAGGMRDALAVLLSPPDAAQEVASRRRVTFVVQCPAVAGWQGHEWYLERSGSGGVYARLARGEPPEWLVPVSPAVLGVDGFIVYRTTTATTAARQDTPNGRPGPTANANRGHGDR